MTLETRTHEQATGGDVTVNVLTTCPVCDYEFTGGESRTRHLLNEHDPEDFGLGESQ